MAKPAAHRMENPDRDALDGGRVGPRVQGAVGALVGSGVCGHSNDSPESMTLSIPWKILVSS